MSERKVIHYDANAFGNLACDAPGCGHTEPMGPLDEALIGKPCPRCGADLLTREDYDAAVRLREGFDLVNKIFGDLGSTEPADDLHRVRVRRRAGNTSVEITKA